MTEQFVPKYYVMDPEIEEIVFDGKSLADGMVILIADPNERARPEKDLDGDWGQDRLLERNRWCTISKVTVEAEVNTLYFLATYEDGTQRKRSHSIQQSWIVKKDSVAASLDVTTERYMNVYNLVLDAMRESENSAAYPNHEYNATVIAEDTTKQILGLL
ncbi:hypothetical protein [Streptomyces phage Psst4]|nr:hypothetical protein [Streptomyces phage Psst1]WPJ30814.1 hypothetical protein [Streptomyces phage Psst4]